MITNIPSFLKSENDLFNMMSCFDLPEVGVALYEVVSGREYYSKDLELDLDREDALVHGLERFGVQNKLRFCNQHFANRGGYSKGELMGLRNLFSLINYDDMTKEDLRIYQQNIQNGRPWYGFGGWKRKDKRYNCSKFINNSVNVDGKLFILAIYQDLSARQDESQRTFSGSSLKPFLKITDVRIRRLVTKTSLKAYATVVFEDSFIIHNLMVIQGDHGLYVDMPNRKTRDGDYKNIVHPANGEFRLYLQEKVLDAYKKAEEHCYSALNRKEDTDA